MSFPRTWSSWTVETGQVVTGDLRRLVDDDPLSGGELPVARHRSGWWPTLGVEPPGDVLRAQGGAVGLAGGIGEEVRGELAGGEAETGTPALAATATTARCRCVSSGPAGPMTPVTRRSSPDQEAQDLCLVVGQFGLVDDGIDGADRYGACTSLAGVGDDALLGGQDAAGGEVQVPVSGVFAVPVAATSQGTDPTARARAG